MVAGIITQPGGAGVGAPPAFYAEVEISFFS